MAFSRAHHNLVGEERMKFEMGIETALRSRANDEVERAFAKLWQQLVSKAVDDPDIRVGMLATELRDRGWHNVNGRLWHDAESHRARAHTCKLRLFLARALELAVDSACARKQGLARKGRD